MTAPMTPDPAPRAPLTDDVKAALLLAHDALTAPDPRVCELRADAVDAIRTVLHDVFDARRRPDGDGPLSQRQVPTETTGEPQGSTNMTPLGAGRDPADARPPVREPLDILMTGHDQAERVAAFLRLYAQRIRVNERWDIPETMAAAYESAAVSLDTYGAEVRALRANLDSAKVEALQTQERLTNLGVFLEALTFWPSPTADANLARDAGRLLQGKEPQNSIGLAELYRFWGGPVLPALKRAEIAEAACLALRADLDALSKDYGNLVREHTEECRTLRAERDQLRGDHCDQAETTPPCRACVACLRRQLKETEETLGTLAADLVEASDRAQPVAWQPIVTAPTDGYFLVYDGKRTMVAYGPVLIASQKPDTPRHLSGHHWTHWCPLPASPTKDQE